jgi:hypothetical protein
LLDLNPRVTVVLVCAWSEVVVVQLRRKVTVMYLAGKRIQTGTHRGLLSELREKPVRGGWWWFSYERRSPREKKEGVLAGDGGCPWFCRQHERKTGKG